MKTPFTGLLTGFAVTALLIAGSSFPSFAEDAATPPPAAQAPASTPAAAPADTSSGAVPRPSIVPKTAEPKTADPSQPAADAAPTPHHRRYAHYRHRHWGNYRYAYWEPFPIFWPHIYHSRIHWNRIPWMFRF